MSIVTLPFFLFVAGLLVVYYLVPKKIRGPVLLIASYVFYWLNSHWLLLVLLGTSLAVYGFGLLIQREHDRYRRELGEHPEWTREEKKARKDRSRKRARRIMVLGILVSAAVLLFLKYFNFFGENLNGLLSLFGLDNPIPKLNLLLPLGISFYTLQAIAYLADVYRAKIQADKNPLKFLLFMSFFPQIIQGPIPRHSQLADQLYEGHAFDYRQVCFGAQMMLWGLIKKLIIAERLAVPVQALYAADSGYTGPIVFFGALLYGFWIYADFSGGMDIARGVAQMLGVNLVKNFNQPYYSTSIEDFWRRWHITMGTWMKDYIFYPLSLSRAFTNLSRKSRKILGQYAGKRLPAFLAMFIVYFLVGFWHGADWKYIVYGVWNGCFIMSGILLENVYRKGRELCRIPENSASWRLFRMFRTLVIVSLGRFFSGADSLQTALAMFKNTATHWKDITFLTNGTLLKLGLTTSNWIILALFLALLFYVDFRHEKGTSFREVFARQPLVFRWGIYIAAVLAILIFGLYGPEYNAAAFIYQQF
jgi:D-alanyl-lipoteichoic acid acyltransferase DltB (MBOAT superfamily)